MRNSACLLALCLSALLVGCGKETEARSQRDQSLRGNPGSRPAGGPVYPTHSSHSSGGVSASSVPDGTDAILESVQVKILDVEKQWATSALAHEGEDGSSYLVLALSIQVRSETARPRLLVQPQRFTLESPEGEVMPLRMSGRKQPVLPTTYLDQGQTVSGWLTFEISADYPEYTLKTDLRQPMISVTVRVPEE